MDLNNAIAVAKQGVDVCDPTTMRPGWRVRFFKDDKLLYYVDPSGEKKHLIKFTDAHRSSIQWTIFKEEN